MALLAGERFLVCLDTSKWFRWTYAALVNNTRVRSLSKPSHLKEIIKCERKPSSTYSRRDYQRSRLRIQQVGREQIFLKLSTFTKILTGATTMKFSISLQQQNIRWRNENFRCKCQGITSTWILSNKKLLHSSAYFDSAFNNFAVLRRTPDMQPIKFIGCKH